MRAINSRFRLSLLLAVIGASVSSSGSVERARGQAGISIDQYRRMFPPAPGNVRVELREGAAAISWDRPPAPPAGKIGYEPEVAAYKVYLVNDLSERRLLGQTTGMSFKDQSRLRPGELRTYAVTAVQRSGIESGMSERVELRVPDAK